MAISSVNQSYSSFSSVLFELTGKSENPASAFEEMLKGPSPEEMLHDMVKDGMEGYMKWQVEQLRKKVAAEVMGEMGITQEALGKMDAMERTAIEKRIMDEVARRLKELMQRQIEEEAKKRGEGSLPLVDNATSSGIFSLLTSAT